jgi:hypothetical protein
MANLLIIGNGFDLAHGLKTDYSSFLKSLILKCITTKKSVEGLIDYDLINPNLRNSREINQNFIYYKHAIKSNFLRHIFVNNNEPNWSDLEDEYFRHISKNIITKDNYNQLISEFHKEFAKIIKELELYLTEQEKKEVKTIESYKHLFHDKLKDHFLIVNFNYTNTLKIYEPDEKKVIHIHGKLNNSDNPIIFGYAANDEDCKILFEKNNNEFIRHVKKYNYSLTDNFQRILRFFDIYKKSRIDVSIFGHSCSMSDKLILNQIFNTDLRSSIESIRFFYYEDLNNPKEPFFQNHINLARVLNGNLDPNKLISFSKSHRMPQKDDNSYQIERFKEYVDNNLKGLDLSVQVKSIKVLKI